MKKTKKIWNKISKIFTTIFFIFSAYLIISSIITTARGGVPKVFGHSFYIVQTPSMEGDNEDSIFVGDLVISDSSKMEDIQVNDIITFRCIDSSQPILGLPITHRVIEIIQEEDGSIQFVTKGDNNPTEDRYMVSNENYYGKIVYRSAFVGKFISLFSSSKGAYVFIGIFLLIAFVVIAEIKNITTTKKEIEEEKAKEKKKEELALLKEELLKEILKDQQEK